MRTVADRSRSTGAWPSPTKSPTCRSTISKASAASKTSRATGAAFGTCGSRIWGDVDLEAGKPRPRSARRSRCCKRSAAGWTSRFHPAWRTGARHDTADARRMVESPASQAVDPDRHGALGFADSTAWLENRSAPRPSASLAERETPFSRRACRPFFGGLLPEESQRHAVARAGGKCAMAGKKIPIAPPVGFHSRWRNALPSLDGEPPRGRRIQSPRNDTQP